MARYAVFDTTTGEIRNIIEWDGTSPWDVPSGCDTVIDNNLEAFLGGNWDGAIFTLPPDGWTPPDPS